MIAHHASLTCNYTRPQHTLQSTNNQLITGLKLQPGLPRVKGFIAAYIGHNPSLSSNSHPYDRTCRNFRTLSYGLDSYGWSIQPTENDS